MASPIAAALGGAGDMDLENLVADVATATLSGSGNIVVHVTRTLDANVSGVGKVSTSATRRR